MPFVTTDAQPLCMFFSIMPGTFEIPTLSSIFGSSFANSMIDGNCAAQKDGNSFESWKSKNSECEDACEEGEGADEAGMERMKKWSYEEDQVLKKYVEVEGLRWNEIVEKMAGRTYQMCYSRYQRIRREKRRSWSKVEEKQLVELVATVGKKWKKISELIPGNFADMKVAAPSKSERDT